MKQMLPEMERLTPHREQEMDFWCATKIFFLCSYRKNRLLYMKIRAKSCKIDWTSGQNTKKFNMPLASVRHLGFDPECCEHFLSQLGPRSVQTRLQAVCATCSVSWPGILSLSSGVWPVSILGGAPAAGLPPAAGLHPGLHWDPACGTSPRATSTNSAWTRRGRWFQCNSRWGSLAAQAHPHISPAPPRGSQCGGEVPELHRGP